MKIDSKDNSKEPILYEVIEYFTRKAEPEFTKCKNDVALPTTGTIKNALRYLNNRYSLPEIITEQIEHTSPWKFAIGGHGKVLALLQDNIIEIRKSKDEYSSIVGKAPVPKDYFPQWRKLVWSPDCNILVLASSNGNLSFYSSVGNNIFNINAKSVSANPDILEAGDAVASIIFKKPTNKNEYDHELIRVTYGGLLKSYYISSNKFIENHEFSFTSFHINGINSCVFSEKHNLFFVAGNSATQSLELGSASENGLTCWRILNEYPYYKLFILDKEFEKRKQRFSIWNIVPLKREKVHPIIFKISISSNNAYLTCLHTDGTISLWRVPSLKLQKQWSLSIQQNSKSENSQPTIKYKKFPISFTEHHASDISWWSDKAIIIARYSGAISVCSIENLENLLGSNPEFLYNQIQIAELENDKGFLSLDCEIIVTSTKRHRDTNNEDHLSEVSSDSEKEEDESKSGSLFNYTTKLVQAALYSATDIEKFQPKRKKLKILHRTYRILGIKKTTPEELYCRKIENQDYNEALTLAKTYNLDTDLVYQTQWRKSDVSLNSIQEHLSKVTKRSWVLNECITRVSEKLEITRELLNFGLKGANLETLAAIAIKDEGKFIPENIDEETEENIEFEENDIQFKKMQKINAILGQIDTTKLSDAQKSLIQYRKILLNHLDKLQVYEILLTSPAKFDWKFYEKFRMLSPIENALNFARDGNCQGVELMFTFYGKLLIPHWLAIVSSFPETLSPQKYKKILPECDKDGQLFLLHQQELRQIDWVERTDFNHINIFENNDTVNSLYEDNTTLLEYKDKPLDQNLLQKWYINRSYEIERECRLIDNSLALCNIGKIHNIRGLERLLFELETLDDVVYKVGLEDMSLIDLEQLNDLQKIKLLMTDSDDSNFISNIQDRLLPFCKRKKLYIDSTSEEYLLEDYLVYISKESLELTQTFFEYLKVSDNPNLLNCIRNVASLAIDCIYKCNDAEMWSQAKTILDIVIPFTTPRDAEHKRCKDLEIELKCLRILNNYNVFIPLHEVRKVKNDTDKAKEVLSQMCNNLPKSNKMPSEKQWTQLLNDMLDIQGFTFDCLDVQSCFEICLSARLQSRSVITIQGCSNLIEMKKAGPSLMRVPYERAVELILKESNNYFNNSKSLTDPDMELAKACLHLITDNNPKISDEYDLIESLQILKDFNINILPLQVRLTKDRMKLVEDCLNSKSDAYKSKQKLLNLSNYLRVENKNTKIREGRVLDLIARKSFKMKDYEFSNSIISQMMNNKYQPAWEIAFDLSLCNNYNNLTFRLTCLWYAINNGPDKIIEHALKHANLLQVEILNRDLSSLAYNDNDRTKERRDGPKEKEDAQKEKFSSFEQRIENNEFMPTFLNSSSDLVKHSTQIVKDSTLDLLNNATSSEFWKTKLNLHLSKTAIGDYEKLSPKTNEYLQKFLCFYESLHNNYGIGSLCTKYSDYNVNPFSKDLKLSQILLRMTLLNATASYSNQTDDISHLLLECSNHTIKEDSILGISYLLHIPSNMFCDQIEELFSHLPENDTFRQMFAYLLSLKLYILLNPNDHNVFLYDPIVLIKSVLQSKIPEGDTIFDVFRQKILSSMYDSSELEKEEKNPGTKEKNELKINSNQVVESDDWNNNWGLDNWIDSNESLERDKKIQNPQFLRDLSDKENYNVFIKKILEVNNLVDFRNLKEQLNNSFSSVRVDILNDIDLNPTLNFLSQLAKLDLQDIDKLIEIKDLLNKQFVTKCLLIEFLENKKNEFTAEEIIHIKLCSNHKDLQIEAVNDVKENYQSLKLEAIILERIFFNDLTSHFRAGHEVYNRILEEIFINYSLPEIKNNIELLIDELMKRGNVPYAVALINQLKSIPPSLSTYDNCFELLIKKR